MDIKLEKLEIFGQGVQAFRITPDTAAVPAAPAHPQPLTENAQRIAQEIREQFRRDRDGR